MSDGTAREYLIDRFRGDAVALRDRVAALAKGTKMPGPDVAMSTRMAEACETVAAMLEALPEESPDGSLGDLLALVPLLERRAQEQVAQPPVRAVYAGAATRIREVYEAEARAAGGNGGRGTPVVPDAEDDEEDDA